MKAVVQRVERASVVAAGRPVGDIAAGLVAFVAAVREDDAKDVQRMAHRLAGIRIFPDGDGKMTLDVREAGGAILLVSNFTVAADTRSGQRPSFDPAAPAAAAAVLLEALQRELTMAGVRVETGEFGADMRVTLVNDGPVTLLLDTRET